MGQEKSVGRVVSITLEASVASGLTTSLHLKMSLFFSEIDGKKNPFESMLAQICLNMIFKIK